MKVLHITNNYPTSKFPIFGIFVKEQIDSLTKTGIKNEVFFINGREKGRKAYIHGFRLLRKKLKNEYYDILHCHHVFSAVILLFTLRFYKFKVIVSYQNPPTREGGLILYKIIKFFFNGIIIKSNPELIKNKKTHYLPNGVNTDFFKPHDKNLSLKKLGLNGENNYILFMDSYNRRTQKRVDRFIKTIKLLQANGNPHKIEPLILTNTKRELIPYYMSISTLHLLTSDFEGSPNSVKECLACNTKIVTTPVGNVDDLIRDIEGCYISNSFEPNELEELVLKAMRHKVFIGREKLLKKELDIENVAHKLVNIYNTIIHEI